MTPPIGISAVTLHTAALSTHAPAKTGEHVDEAECTCTNQHNTNEGKCRVDDPDVSEHRGVECGVADRPNCGDHCIEDQVGDEQHDGTDEDREDRHQHKAGECSATLKSGCNLVKEFHIITSHERITPML